jgi:hypothetical protein
VSSAPRQLAAIHTLAIVAAIALATAGCSQNSADTGSSTATSAAAGAASTATGSSPAAVTSTGGGKATSSTRAKAVKFAECMRSNGVSGFPDPDSSGALTLDSVANGTSVDTSSAGWKRAIGACQKLQPPGFTGTGRTPEQQQAALKFAQCVRDHGVKDFPDPTKGAPLIDTNHIPSAATSAGMAILNAALGHCGKFAAAAGVTAGR